MIHPATVTFCPDMAQLSAVAAQVRPTIMNGVPRVWEKLQAALTARIAAEPDTARRQAAETAIEAGRRLVRCRRRGEPVPQAVRAAAERIAPLRRTLLTLASLGACRLATSGAAPIDPEVFEFFQALGLPMAEAWGMTELTGRRHPQPPRPGRATALSAPPAPASSCGDVGTLDTGGHLRIVDHKKALIITSGGREPRG